MKPSEDSEVISLSEDGVAIFWCPGCETYHGVWVDKKNELTGANWQWNGDKVNPTFKPSILVNKKGDYYNPGEPTCHSFVTNGSIRFLNDCTHKLAGQTVPLKPDEKDNGD